MKKHKQNEHLMNSFKALVNATPFTPANLGFFSNPSSAASNRPRVHGKLSIQILITTENIFIFFN